MIYPIPLVCLVKLAETIEKNPQFVEAIPLIGRYSLILTNNTPLITLPSTLISDRPGNEAAEVMELLDFDGDEKVLADDVQKDTQALQETKVKYRMSLTKYLFRNDSQHKEMRGNSLSSNDSRKRKSQRRMWQSIRKHTGNETPQSMDVVVPDAHAQSGGDCQWKSSRACWSVAFFSVQGGGQYC